MMICPRAWCPPICEKEAEILAVPASVTCGTVASQCNHSDDEGGHSDYCDDDHDIVIIIDSYH